MKWQWRLIPALCVSFFGPFACHSQPATNLWELQLCFYECSSSPALARDGTIYQGTFDGKLFAVTPHGDIQWTFPAGREIKSSPAIADDGTIYFGSRDRKLYAVSPEGKLKWTFSTDGWVDSSPAIASDGTIYFGSWDTNFYALNPNGSLKWRFPTGDVIDSSPAIAADGTVYFGSHDKNLYALAPDGKLRWKYPTQGQISSSPAINSDGTIYIPSTDGNLYALNSDGSEKWHLRTGSASASSPVIDPQGEIYLGGCYKKFGISPDGKRLWDWGSPAFIDSTAAVASNGQEYFCGPWFYLDAMDSGGNLRWNIHVNQMFIDSPVISPEGTIYVMAGRMLTAISVTNHPGLAKSAWPMWRGNPQHTGRVSLNR